MKLVIIYGEVSTTHQLIIEEAEQIFDSVLAVPVQGLKYIHSSEESKVLYKGTDLTEYDAAFVRTNDNDRLFSEHLVEVLNDAGVVTQSADESFAYSNNKFYSMKICAENQVNVPNSFYTLSPETAVEAAEKLGYPIIMKTIGGAGGQGVMRATSENELKPVMDTMKAFKQDICLQEYREHDGTDTRIIVIGDQTFSYKRSSQGDEWRSNVAEGGERKEANPSEEMKKSAKRAVRAAGFDICGVDVIDTEDGVYVLELNSAFGLYKKINEIVEDNVILRLVERMHERAMKEGVQ